MTNTANIAAKDAANKPDSRDAMWPSYSPPTDIVFTHGRGSELFTEDGQTYLDFLSGIAVTGFGHAHPHLVAALKEQAEKLWHLSNVFRIPEGERLAKRLTENSFADRVFFANSGTEAIEAGIKAVRGYQAGIGKKERYRLIGFSDSFHGRTIAAVAASGNPSYMQNFVPTDHGFDQVAWGDLEAVKQAIGENTAGIIVETVQGEGGIRPVTPEFIHGLRALCDEHGLLLMLDEVQCGVGRTGKLFAYEHYDVRPDVMSLAKGLGGGFPIGACLTTEEVGKHMIVGTHGSTFGGNPLAMAVGNAILDLVLEPQLLADIERKGARLKQGLEELITRFPTLISATSGLGLMIGVKCEIPNADMLVALRNAHLLVGRAGDNMIRLLPPMNVSDEHIEKALSIIENTLESLGKSEGNAD